MLDTKDTISSPPEYILSSEDPLEYAVKFTSFTNGGYTGCLVAKIVTSDIRYWDLSSLPKDKEPSLVPQDIPDPCLPSSCGIIEI